MFGNIRRKGLIWVLLGTTMLSWGDNLIITPLGLYNGGLMGVSQLIRTGLVQGLGLSIFSKFDIEVVVYSLIYTTVLAMPCDRAHVQNINMSAMIFTKKEGISEAVLQEMRRGVTAWDGVGAYTNEDTHIYYIMISKYEVEKLKEIVKHYVGAPKGCLAQESVETDSFLSYRNLQDILQDMQ